MDITKMLIATTAARISSAMAELYNLDRLHKLSTAYRCTGSLNRLEREKAYLVSYIAKLQQIHSSAVQRADSRKMAFTVDTDR